MHSILQKLFLWSAEWGYRKFIGSTRKTHEVQSRFLRQYLNDHKGTEFGQSLDFEQIKDIDDFRSRIPAMEFADHKPYFDRTFQGESNIIVPDQPVFFAMTGGTTGGKKVVPMTARSQRIRNRSRQASTAFFARAIKKRGIDIGPVLLMNTTAMTGHTEQGIAYGSSSSGDLSLNRRNYKIYNLFPFPYEAFGIEGSCCQALYLPSFCSETVRSENHKR